MALRLPDDSKRHLILGSTGSGKTVHGIHHLSMRGFDVMPWLVIDYKRDEHIAGIPGANFIGLDELPDGPGIYVVNPMPDDDIEPLLWNVWRRGSIGLFVDEGYMLGKNNRAYRALLTQGRSKKIPIITLSQRPKWLDPFILSESEFISTFHLNKFEDRKYMEDYVPYPLSKNLLPEYYSIYYYVGDRETVHPVKPSPPMKHIYSVFAHRLRNHRDKL